MTLKEIYIKAYSHSKYIKFPSYKITGFIAKNNDDLRQESMTMQIIKAFDNIFKQNNIPLKLKPYEIVVTSNNSGLIEYLTDTISIDYLKKYLKTKKMGLSTFFNEFFKNNISQAKRNFAESLAAYSLVTYVLNLKVIY